MLRRDVAEIERSARFVQRNAVQQNLRVVAFAAPDEQRRHVSVPAATHDGRADSGAKQIGHRRRLPALEVLAIEHGDARRKLPGRRFTSRGGHDDRFLNRCDSERQVNRIGRAGGRHGLEAGDRRFDATFARDFSMNPKRATLVGERRRDHAVVALHRDDRARQWLARSVRDNSGQRDLRGGSRGCKGQ